MDANVDLVKQIVSEPGTDSPQAFARRVRRLAAEYVLMHLGSLAGVVLLAWKGKLFVTLAQRSNVETLTILFFLVFFAYLAAISARGAWGALRIFGWWLRARGGKDVEARKAEALGPPRGEAPVVGLSVLVERQSQPGRAFELAVADRAGPMGVLRIDGTALSHRPVRRDGSVNLLAFFAVQATQLLEQRGAEAIEIVEWGSIDDDGLLKWNAHARFARALGQKLGADLFPVVRLTDAECDELQRRLSAVCPALRDDGFLPEWEYSTDHKLPVVPEPLGLITLGRSEKRADPVMAMGFATAVVYGVLAIIVTFILSPPWVPG